MWNCYLFKVNRNCGEKWVAMTQPFLPDLRDGDLHVLLQPLDHHFGSPTIYRWINIPERCKKNRIRAHSVTIDRSIDWLIVSLIGCYMVRLIDWLIISLIGCYMVRLIDWLIDCHTVGLIDCYTVGVIDWLIDLFDVFYLAALYFQPSSPCWCVSGVLETGRGGGTDPAPLELLLLLLQVFIHLRRITPSESSWNINKISRHKEVVLNIKVLFFLVSKWTHLHHAFNFPCCSLFKEFPQTVLFVLGEAALGCGGPHGIWFLTACRSG